MTNPERLQSSPPTDQQIRGFHELVAFISCNTPEGEATLLDDGRLLRCEATEGVSSSVSFSKPVTNEVAGKGQETTFYHIDLVGATILKDVETVHENPPVETPDGADVLAQLVLNQPPSVTAQELDDVIGDMLRTLI